MAELSAPGSVASPALPRARQVPGELWLARGLRAGAVSGGALFFASMGVQAVGWGEAAQVLRQLAASVLLVTPIVRLVAGGAMLGLRGERRFALSAAGVLLLLALGLALGVSGH